MREGESEMTGKRKLESESPSKSKGRVKWWRERLRQMERIANATPRPIHCLRWHVCGDDDSY